MNSPRTTETDEMNEEEMFNIATAVLKNKVRENSKKIVAFWQNLKETGNLFRELRNLEESTGVSPKTMTAFAAIILEPYAPEIFGKPKKQMSDSEIGEISLDVLIGFARREGFRVLSKDQERRSLGNIASITGIKPERLMIFSNLFLKMAIDAVFPLPNRSI